MVGAALQSLCQYYDIIHPVRCVIHVVQGMLVTLGDEDTGQNPECEGGNIVLYNKYKMEPQVQALISQLRKCPPSCVLMWVRKLVPFQKHQAKGAVLENIPCCSSCTTQVPCQELLFSSLTHMMVTMLSIAGKSQETRSELQDSQFYPQLCYCLWGNLRQIFTGLFLNFPVYIVENNSTRFASLLPLYLAG